MYDYSKIINEMQDKKDFLQQLVLNKGNCGSSVDCMVCPFLNLSFLSGSTCIYTVMTILGMKDETQLSDMKDEHWATAAAKLLCDIAIEEMLDGGANTKKDT